MSAARLDFARCLIEAAIEPFEDGLNRISFFLTDADLKRIQQVGGGDAFLDTGHAQIVLEQLLMLGTEKKEDELRDQEQLF
jgi:CO dehydrogenase/acetyl-CoA synthase epsilon subunit